MGVSFNVSGCGEALVHFPSETISKVTVLAIPEKGKPLHAWGVEEDTWIIENVETVGPEYPDRDWVIWVKPVADA
jgi:hypothetical protein